MQEVTLPCSRKVDGRIGFLGEIQAETPPELVLQTRVSYCKAGLTQCNTEGDSLTCTPNELVDDSLSCLGRPLAILIEPGGDDRFMRGGGVGDFEWKEAADIVDTALGGEKMLAHC